MGVDSLIFAAGGLVVGALLGVLMAKLQGAKALAPQQQTTQAEIQQRIQAETQLQSIQQQFNTLDEKGGQLQRELTQALQDKAALRAEYDTLKTQLTEAAENKDLRFKEFLLEQSALLKTELEEKASKEYKEKNELMNKDLRTLLQPIEKLVKENEERVKELSTQTLKETTTLKVEIQKAMEQTQLLTEAKNRIVSVLSDNKGRGDWGELQLLKLLELSGLVKDRDYIFQQAQSGQGRPDVRINLPNGHILYIDAKTLVGKLEHFEQHYEENRSDEERKKLTASLKNEILKLSARDYQGGENGSVDFVILYVPRESMLRIPLEEHPTLIDEAFQKNIILCSPLILMAILKTVAQGWANAKVENNANEVINIGRELHKRACTLIERFDGFETTLMTLNKKFEDTKKSFTGNQGFIPQIKKLEDLGAKSPKSIPDSLDFQNAIPSLDTAEPLLLNSDN